jgi:hypothetical protein
MKPSWRKRATTGLRAKQLEIARGVQKLIRSPECPHGAQDTGNPGRRQGSQNARIAFFGGTTVAATVWGDLVTNSTISRRRSWVMTPPSDFF